MLKVHCFDEDVDEVKSCVLENLQVIGVDEDSITVEDNVLEIDGSTTLYNGTPEYDFEKLILIEEDISPEELLSRIKEEYPEVKIEGSLLFGDDNYRRFFWFESESGEEDVSVDFALGCDEMLHDAVGFPASDCVYLYFSSTDYGLEVFGIKTEEDLNNAVEVMNEFRHYLEENSDSLDDDDYQSLWEQFVEESEDPDRIDGLFGAQGSVVYFDKVFIDDFTRHTSQN